MTLRDLKTGKRIVTPVGDPSGEGYAKQAAAYNKAISSGSAAVVLNTGTSLSSSAGYYPSNVVYKTSTGSNLTPDDIFKKLLASPDIQNILATQQAAAEQRLDSSDVKVYNQLESLKQDTDAKFEAITEHLGVLADTVATQDMLPQNQDKSFLEKTSDFMSAGTNKVFTYAALAFGGIIIYNLTKKR